jgi:hypothetical protein
MALVSPGINISINDQSQYVNSNIGSVPLVVLATAENKTYNGVLSAGTTKANAGKLLSFTSQRDLITQMGTPTFQVSSAGTPVNGSEINEYGLMAAYSALGLTNQLFAVRADVDLNQLKGTSIRPSAAPKNGTYWLDTATTQWGLYTLDAVTGTFASVAPLVITSASQVQNDTNFSYAVPTPINSVGTIGQYAVVTVNVDGTTAKSLRLFYKAGANSFNLNNQWVQVGSANWQNATPVVTGTVQNPSIPVSSTLTVNGVIVTSSSSLTTVAALAASINSSAIPGVSAIATTAGFLQLFVTSAAKSNGSVVDGKLLLVDGTNSPLSRVGIAPSTGTNNHQTTNNATGAYYAPYFFYGSYAQAPAGGWFATDSQPRPSGSIWWKTTSTGGGFAPTLFQYNGSLQSFAPVSVPAYSTYQSAVYALDPVGGGVNISAGSVFARYGVDDTTSNGLHFDAKVAASVTAGTGGSSPTFTASQTFTISASAPGSSTLTAYTITTSGSTASSFVADILSANIPYVTAVVNANGSVTISHTTSGIIKMSDVSGSPIENAGFTVGQGSGFSINTTSTPAVVTIKSLSGITSGIVYSANQPYSAPDAGTYWYYSNPADIDVMINEVVGGVQRWRGYKNVTSDVRGYNLSLTDSNGVIIAPNTAPVAQSTGASLVAGDLWLDSGDLENYPALYRYNGSSWVAINNADHTSSAGIAFADARWDASGTTDPISGDMPAVTGLLTSDYIDQDAPDYRLFPRGTILFNTRRSGYNVKKYVPGYFNATSFPTLPTVPGAAGSLPTQTGTWVSAAGLDSNGVMFAGSMAQRAIVVSAMKAALDSNLDALSPSYQYNLIVAPGYPELIPNMLTLNDNRGDTAFVIGDTPMDLAPDTIDITNWVNNASGNGLTEGASPYLALYYPAGKTNDLAGNEVVVPASHAVLRTYLYNDQVSYPWFAPAGAARGIVTNLGDIGYINKAGNFVHNGIAQGLRDALANLSINPITQLPGAGLVVFGQLTRSLDTTSRNRVNVVRLENYLRTIFNSVANGYLFEPNDAVTRKSIATQIESALNNILAHRGLYDYLVICDTSNNTPSSISNNQLFVDVAIEPERDVEFIYIPIAIYNPGTVSSLNTSST